MKLRALQRLASKRPAGACFATVCALALSGRLAAADLSPSDFAFGMTVAADAGTDSGAAAPAGAAAAAAYRVTLPLSVYQNLAREDFADIRVFNARGEVVPYALTRPAARTMGRGPAISLPLFALRGDSPAAADALRVTIDSPNTAITLQTQGGPAARGAATPGGAAHGVGVPGAARSGAARSGAATAGAATSGAAVSGSVRQYILDGRAVTVPVASLQFAWPDDAADFTGRLRIEVSDDFSVWRTLADAAPIANLHADGRQLVRNRIEVPQAQAKYWRLSWVGKTAPFELTAVLAEPADRRVDAERSTVEVAGHADAAGDYLFDLGARLPIESINLALPENNAVADVELWSRGRPQDPWRRVAARQFYRVDTADGELRNQAIDIAVDADRYWRARLAAPGGGAAALEGGAAAPGGGAAAQTLRLQAAWTPRDVVFLARGPAPFLLAFGSAVAGSAQTDLSSVSAAVTIARATLGERRPLGGQARLAAPAAPFPWKRVLLWSVLGVSVCLLAGMAYRLTKDLGRE